MVAQCAPDTVFVYDADQNRLYRYNRDGALIATGTTNPFAPILRCSPDHRYVALHDILDTFFPSAQTAGRMYRFPVDVVANGDTVRLYDSLPGYDPRPGGRMFSLTLAGHITYVGLTDSAWVAQFDAAGRVARTFRISNDPAPSTQAYYEQAVDRFLGQFATGQFNSLKPQLLKVPRPEHMPAWHALYGSPDGTLWVQITSPFDSTTELREFDSLGTAMGEVTLPFPLTIFEIGNDYLLGMRENEAGEQRVVVYRMGEMGEMGEAGR
jgi:hypothetical protein